MLSWLVVGGGIHGTHLAVVLLERCGVPADGLRVLDPHEAPLASWRECCRRVGMDFLRSPAVHHLGVRPYDLLEFARSAESRADARFAPPYGRPSFALFDAHCRHVVQRAGVDRVFLRGRAERMHLLDDRVRVDTDRGVLDAERVVLALGARAQPSWPEWARELARQGGSVAHVYDERFDASSDAARGSTLVLGGGLSGAQLALRLAKASVRPVILLTRTALRVHQFDSDPGWLGPKFLGRFHRTASAAKRRRMIRDARHTGSVTPDVRYDLLRAIRAGTVKHMVTAVRSARALADGTAIVETKHGRLDVARVLLATGFDPVRPGGILVDDLARRYDLALSECGYPLLDGALRWHPRLFVTGPLAELEIGPVSRNISGARKAAERIAHVA